MVSHCDGHPFTFHAEYNTARKQNMVPWTALEAGVLMEQEIGHFETCDSLRYRDGFRLTGAGQSYVDPKVYQTCMGGSEGRHSRGEGPWFSPTRSSPVNAGDRLVGRPSRLGIPQPGGAGGAPLSDRAG